MILHLDRTYTKSYTEGVLTTPFGDFHILELPWKDNERGKSCIPEGTYTVFKDKYRGGKKKGKPAFRFRNVSGRSGILLHIGNFLKDTDGCLIPGMRFDHTVPAVYDSTIAFNLLWKYLPDEFTVNITSDSDDFLFFNDWKTADNVNGADNKKFVKKAPKGWLVLFLMWLLSKLE